MIRKIKDYILNNPLDTLKLALYSVLLIFSFVMGRKSVDKEIFAQFWLTVEIFLIFLIFRIIYRTVLKQKLKKIVGKSFSKLKKALRNIADLSKKLFSRFGNKDKGVYIEGKDSYSFLFKKKDRETQSQKKEKQKKRKWSDLQTAYDKLRFVYSKTINKKIKKGVFIKSTNTPAEISCRFAENETEKEMFVCYNDVRYRENPNFDEEKVEFFVDSLDRHDKK